jgi:hypothetical protein
VTPTDPTTDTPQADLDHLAEWLSWLIPGGHVQDHGVETLVRIVQEVPTSALRRIDKKARRTPGGREDHPGSLDADTMRRLLAAHGDNIAVVTAASLHRSGFVREAAVRHLADQWTGEEFRWLLLRCADAVPQVQTIAERAVRDRALTPELSGRYRSRVLDAVSLITSKRFDRARPTLQADLVDFLLQPPPEPEYDDPLGAASWSRDLPTRRAAVELLIRRDKLLALLQGQARRDDVVALSTVATAAFADAAICEKAARSLFADDNARLRAIGLRHLVEHGHPAHDAVNAAMRDRAPNVRSVAQDLYARRGDDPRAFYLGHVTDDPVGCLVGLGDVGSPSDTTLAVPFLDSADRYVRAAAIRLVARLGSSEHLPTLLAAIGERRPVARDAVAGIVRIGVGDNVARVAVDQAGQGRSAQRRRVYRRLLHGAPPPIALQHALEAITSDDPELRFLGVGLVRWISGRWKRSPDVTSPPEASELWQLLERAAPHVGDQDPAILDDVRRILSPPD